MNILKNKRYGKQPKRSCNANSAILRILNGGSNIDSVNNNHAQKNSTTVNNISKNSYQESKSKTPKLTEKKIANLLRIRV